jgi:hypothetical protein
VCSGITAPKEGFDGHAADTCIHSWNGRTQPEAPCKHVVALGREMIWCSQPRLHSAARAVVDELRFSCFDMPGRRSGVGCGTARLWSHQPASDCIAQRHCRDHGRAAAMVMHQTSMAMMDRHDEMRQARALPTARSRAPARQPPFRPSQPTIRASNHQAGQQAHRRASYSAFGLLSSRFLLSPVFCQSARQLWLLQSSCRRARPSSSCSNTHSTMSRLAPLRITRFPPLLS